MGNTKSLAKFLMWVGILIILIAITLCAVSIWLTRWDLLAINSISLMVGLGCTISNYKRLKNEKRLHPL
jgi:hypothetical protein